MNGDDAAQPNAADSQDDATNEEQEITLTFSYEPQAALEELFGVGEETLFHAFDLALARVGVAESVEVSVLITTDEGIRALNRDFRGKDEATDVLSFPLLDHPIVTAPDDQLWQPSAEEDDEDEDDLSDDFADDEDGEQALKGKIVLLGDDTDGHDDQENGGDEDDFGDDSEIWPTHLGDIAIARETVLRQAQQAGHSAAWELAFLFIHGLLHLVGFDDQTDAGYQAMVAHQEAVLAEAGVTR